MVFSVLNQHEEGLKNNLSFVIEKTAEGSQKKPLGLTEIMRNRRTEVTGTDPPENKIKQDNKQTKHIK